MSEVSSLGKSLKLIRLMHGKTATTLARELGITPAYLSEIENCVKAPSANVINAYAKTFHIRRSTIYFFDDELDEENDGRGKSLRSYLLKFMEAVRHCEGKSLDELDDFDVP